MISRKRLLIAAGIGIGLIGMPLTLVILARPEPGDSARCTAATATLQRLRPLAKGEVAAFHVPGIPRALPDLAFKAPDGTPRTLASYSGRVTLVNLWATWCSPCRKEMPALDALQAEFGGPDFEVVAINIDTHNLDKPREWLKDNAITRLAYYSDHEAKVFQDLRAIGKAIGMPTTILVDGKGCELGLLHGGADWASNDARKLIRAALEPKA